ncbi:MAG TPA: AzlD domain-containing protein [Dongiaceae bacterium]
MPIRPDALIAILLMGVASYACRAGGYFLMRYVTVTPRVEAWLKAIPVALIGAILGPIAANGGPAEWLGLATAVLLMKFIGNDFVAVVGSVAMVVLTRFALG